MAVPLTNMLNGIHDYIDVNALTLYYARAALSKNQINRHNFQIVTQQHEMSLATLSKSQAKYSPVDAATMQETQTSMNETLQYLAMYLFGLFKSTLMSPPIQMAPVAPALDQVAYLNFQVSHMSPEEVVPIFYPQVYDVTDPSLND
jgi:hypothetical protein